MSLFAKKVVEQKKKVALEKRRFDDEVLCDADFEGAGSKPDEPLAKKANNDDDDSSNDAPLSTFTLSAICQPRYGTLESLKQRQLLIIAVGQNGRIRSFSCNVSWQSAQKVTKLCEDIKTITPNHARLDAENQLYYALSERINVNAPRSKLCVIAFETTVYTTKALIPDNEVEKWRSDEHTNPLNAKMQSNTFVISFNTKSTELPADELE